MDALQRVGMVVGGAALVAVGAQVDVPMQPVPMSLQSFAVVLVGGLLGRTLGPAAMVLYLAAGAIGLPVFADGRSGVDVLTGATAGYLVAFVPAAWITGRPGPRPFLYWLKATLLGHAAILALGFLWLATRIGAAEAWQKGVEPFIAGMIVKSAVAALVLFLWRRRWLKKRD